MTTHTIHYHGEVTAGYTRMCLDPWSKCFIKADGTVRLCCYETAVGNINDNSLDEILNNERTIAYRNGLLTGQLLPMCKICGYKPVVTVKELSSLVESKLYNPARLALSVI